MAEGMLATAVSVKSGSQNWLRIIQAGLHNTWVKSGSKLAERYGDSIRRYASITAVSVKSGSKLAERYWASSRRFARITAVSVKYGSQNWLTCMEIVLEGMPKSQQSRSNLDQNWLRGMGIVAEGMLESASLGQIWIKTG